MRVTNQSIIRNSVARLQENMQGMERARRDIATGRRIHVISEDPTAGGELVRVGSNLRAIEQYRRNIELATGRANTEENVLDGLTNTLGRGIEVAMNQSSGTSSAQTRTIAKAEIDQLIAHAVSLGNTKFEDTYVLGGTRTGEPPLRVPASASDSFSALADANGDPVDPSGSIELEVGDGKFVTATHNATEIFLDTGALEALRSLSTALGNNDQAGISAATRSLQQASSSVQTLVGQQGARGLELISATDTLGAHELSLESFRGALGGTEVEKTMIELVARQNRYEAAMAVTSRVLGLSLANYI